MGKILPTMLTHKADCVAFFRKDPSSFNISIDSAPTLARRHELTSYMDMA